MKIIIVIGYFDLFSNYQETCIARELVRQGHEVTVIAGNQVDYIFPDEALRSHGVTRVYPDAEQEINGLRIVRLKPFLNKRAMVLARGLNKELKRRNPDLVICMKPGQLLSTTLRRPGKSTRIVSIFDDNRGQYAGLKPMAKLAKRAVFYLTKGLFYKRLISASDQVFTNTPNGGKIIKPLLGRKSSKLLPLSFDQDLYKADSSLRKQLRDELEFGPKNLAFIITGKVIPKKRLEDFIHLFAKLSPSFPDLRLVIIGASKNTYTDSLRALSQALNLSEVVHILGFLPPKEIVGYLNAADIGIWHQQPAISIQQAMGTGLFCILPQNDLVGHLLTPETGSYFPEGNFGKLQELITQCAAQLPAELQSGRFIRAQLNSKFSQREVVQQLLRSSVK